MDALFIDVSNLNVLFKYSGKFVLGASYLSCPEKLLIDAQSLGNSYDIYLSMWPRPEGEGDVIVHGLSHGRVPFVALREELEALLRYIEKFPGHNTIYLCNALANFTIPSRVSKYQAVLPYGSRYALVDVKDKILDRLVLFENQREFYEVLGEDFNCYGDGDIVDVDSIRAQYPELADYKKNILVPLTPLIISYHSTYKMTVQEVRECLNGPPEEEPIREEPQPVKKEAPIPEPDEGALPRHAKMSRPKMQIDFVSVLLSVVVCAAMFMVGIGYSAKDIDKSITTQNMGAQAFREGVAPYARIQAIYDSGYTMAGNTADVYTYAKATEHDVSITMFDATAEGVKISFSCTSIDVKDSYVAYLNSQYVVANVNEGQPIANTDGTTSYQYTALVIP